MKTVWAKHYELGWLRVYLATEATSWMNRDQWVDYNDPEAGYYETEDFGEWKEEF